MLLSDYEHAVARRYDVVYDSFLPQIGLDMGGVPKRAVYVIDRAGVIQYFDCDEDARVVPDFHRVKAALKELA